VVGGLYDGSKESFPLTVPEGVNLLKASGAIPTIVGGGMLDPQDAQNVTAAVVLRAYAQLGKFHITNPKTTGSPGFHYGVAVVGEGAHLHQTRLTGSRHGGIRVIRGEGTIIAGCQIHDHALGLGVHFAGGGQGGIVWGCDIYANHIGVEYDAEGASLNGFDQDFMRNALHGNTFNDVWVVPGVTVVATYNRWDHFGPSFTTQSNHGLGVDIYHLHTVLGVDTAGAELYVP